MKSACLMRAIARWQTMKTPLDSDHFGVATDLYYVNVRKS